MKPACHLSVEQLRPFAPGGAVYRAFDHAIAAGHGTLLMVPIGMCQGLGRELPVGCPVPFEEVLAVREAAAACALPFTGNWDYYGPAARRLAMLGLVGWDLGPLRMPRSERIATLFSHPSGVRYAVTLDLLLGAPAWPSEVTP